MIDEMRARVHLPGDATCRALVRPLPLYESERMLRVLERGGGGPAPSDAIGHSVGDGLLGATPSWSTVTRQGSPTPSSLEPPDAPAAIGNLEEGWQWPRPPPKRLLAEMPSPFDAAAAAYSVSPRERSKARASLRHRLPPVDVMSRHPMTRGSRSELLHRRAR